MSDQSLNKEIQEHLKKWPVLFQPYARANTRKAITQILNSVLPFIGIWILMYYSLDWSYWITLGLGLINAFFVVRIFIIQHDCGHRSFFKNQAWNNITGWFTSFITTIPFKYWARVHDFHHAHSGQLEVRDIGDIDTMTVKEFREADKSTRLKYKIFRNPFVLFIVVPIVYFTVNNRVPKVSYKGWKKVHLEQHINNLALLALYIILGFALGWKNFLLVQVPIIFFFAIIAIWFFFVQHQHEDGYKHWQSNWDYLISAIRGSTSYVLPRWMHWLTGNIGFHHIHHLNSRIPNYNLMQCARENKFLEKYITKVTFFESLKYATHKLWDEESERMITFAEFYRMEKGMA